MDSSLTTGYLRWTFIRAALARGWWLATAVYLVTVADLPPAQLVLIGVFQGLTVVVAEVPAGVLADTISRRLALVVAHVVMGAGMALTGFVTDYPLIMLSQCLWGLGWAISSGADVAWITDELDRPDVIDRVLTAQGRYDLLGNPTGIILFGALAWATDLSTAIVVAGIGMIGLGVVVVARWPESNQPEAVPAGRWATSVETFRQGAATARRDRVVALVLIATLLVNGGAEGFGRLFERHVLDLGLPTSTDPIVWFAAIGVLAALLGSLSLFWVEAHIDGRRVATGAYVAASATAAIGLFLFAHAPNVEAAIAAALLVKGTGFPVVRVAATILVNRQTTSQVRATVHSLLSQAENLGEILFGLILAAVAASWSPTITLVGAALLVAAAGITVSRASDPSAHTTGDLRQGRAPDPIFSQKPQAHGVRWIEASAVDAPPLEVDVVTMTGNVAQVFLTDEEWTSVLSAAWHALRPGGHLVFETRIPARRAWETWTRQSTRRRLDIDRTGAVETWTELTSVSLPLVSFRHVFRFEADATTLTSSSTLRFRTRAEIIADLESVGFEICDVRDAPDRPDLEWVFIARRSR